MTTVVPVESIVSKIVLLRGEKVLLDRDLAELYDVETKQLKRAVRRHGNRFPEDFMFQLTKEEYRSLRSQFGTLNRTPHMFDSRSDDIICLAGPALLNLR